jgi:tetratricopeptide (TPR) repeat protein
MKIKTLLYITALTFYSCATVKGSGDLSTNNQSLESNRLNKFANCIEESIQNGNPSFLNKAFDFNFFMQKIYSVHKSNNETEFNEGFQEGLKNNFDIGSMIINEINKKGSYTFLHSSTKNGSPRLLFRLMSEKGINYHEYEIKQVDGNPMIVDIFLFNSGENISESIGSIYETFRTMNAKDNIESNEALVNYKELQKIKTLVSRGKNRKAFNYWLNLPTEIRCTKTFLIAGIQLASGMDKEKFELAYTDFQKFFPDNQSKFLIPIEGFIASGNYPKALSCIDSLDARLDTDPMLNYLRAKFLYEMGNKIESANRLNMLIQSIPDFENGYLSLLQLYINDKAYLKATEILDKMVSNLNYYKSSMNSYLSNYPEFYQSNEFQIWFNQ